MFLKIGQHLAKLWARKLIASSGTSCTVTLQLCGKLTRDATYGRQ